MKKEEIQNKINKNRDLIDRFVRSELDLNIIYMNVRILARRNEKLIDQLNT